MCGEKSQACKPTWLREFVLSPSFVIQPTDPAGFTHLGYP